MPRGRLFTSEKRQGQGVALDPPGAKPLDLGF